ncbi:MAG: hypothetical protein ACI8WT_003063 [Clostridium sp.]|jgi:hypothetical protein
MYKIKYYYSSVSKQIFIITLILAIVTRLILFFVGGFYEQFNTFLSILMYIVALLCCIFFFTAYKFFYSEFDEKTVTSYNLLLRQTKEADLSKVEKGLLSKSGISLYYDKTKKPNFFIPFYNFGNISPVGVENFTIMLQNLGVEIEKQYKYLPGYGKSSTLFSYGYIIISIITFINSFQYGILVILILFSSGQQ